MDRTQANNLVKQTFTQAFEKSRFRAFILNLLNHLDETKAQVWSHTYVKDAFKAHVQHYERLGTYTSPDGETLDVLIVHLTQAAKLERARTVLRNFVADHLKTRDNKDAALVAFVAPATASWRFSYIRMDYATVTRDSGAVGVEAHLTPARRFSYIVGAGESCHTAQTRFLNLLQDTAADPNLAALESAFSVETVTKEFFKEYVARFDAIHTALDDLLASDAALRAEFDARHLNSVDFAKKLLGQIVFLYFLQRKGWLGAARGADWGSGPRDFLRRLANGDYGAYANFFNDVLEPLFYDTLAADRGHAAWCERFACRIPFLNGGLFETPGGYDWRAVDLHLPDALFTNTTFVEEGVIGDGVLDVFDRYNFTVNEAEPLETEVAIDPEMLGKVFENLIEDNRRKGLGAFYTPREIVHYMCQESLINYLDTAVNTRGESWLPQAPMQSALFGDPAPEQATLATPVYAELVPRADLETLVHYGEQIAHYESVAAEYPIKMPASVKKHARAIDEALAAVAVCDPAVGSGAFLVGMMTEIVHARSALTPYFTAVTERTPYVFKRHAIQNCLYGVDIDPGAVDIAKLRLWLSLVVDEEDVQQIKPLPNLDYKIVVGNSLLGFPFKSQRLGEVERLKQAFFDETDPPRKAALKAQTDKLLADCFAASEKSLGYKVDFDFAIYFSEVFREKRGFDVVIGNPPYVRQEQIKEFKPLFKKQFTCYTGTADLYVYFYERGFRLLRDNGVLTFISSNKYFRAGYGEKLRRFLSSQMALRKLIDFGDAPVFEAIAYPSILVAQKAKPAARELDALTWEAGKPLATFENVVRADTFALAQNELTADGWRLEAPTVLRLLEKLRRAGAPLGEYVNGQFYYGIKTGLNEAFVVDRATRDRLVAEHPSSAEVLKPFLRGRDVKRWRVIPHDLWLIFTRRGINIEKYPAIHKYLEQFKDRLMPGVPGGRKPGSYKWYEIQDNIAYWQEFEKPKIIIPAIAQRVEYAPDDTGYFSNDKTSICVTNQINYLLGILNSQLFWWFIQQTAASKQGGFYEFKPMYVTQIPIPESPIPDPIAPLVDRILAAKRADPAAAVSAWEREIDALVYQLYGLTAEEIAIVEGTQT
ncbi:MAG: Eco57I restriction-modification methylase domain-containing protein [Anaerolineae bacterium]|nr:Eco57I restriction-modification methylase domain-containing protein [Anaerolineae bacterium]